MHLLYDNLIYNFGKITILIKLINQVNYPVVHSDMSDYKVEDKNFMWHLPYSWHLDLYISIRGPYPKLDISQ